MYGAIGNVQSCQQWLANDICGTADELNELRRLEKEKGIQPDPEIDAFMKANAIEGKRESIETEYVLHILGLGVCADTLVGFNCQESILYQHLRLPGGPKRDSFGYEKIAPIFASHVFSRCDSPWSRRWVVK